jgi:hypothetical protein
MDTDSDEDIGQLYLFSSLLMDEVAKYTILSSIRRAQGAAEDTTDGGRAFTINKPAIQWGDLVAGMLLIKQAIPCMIYLENRSGEKILE